jgi:hypothetical protein
MCHAPAPQGHVIFPFLENLMLVAQPQFRVLATPSDPLPFKTHGNEVNKNGPFDVCSL